LQHELTLVDEIETDQRITKSPRDRLDHRLEDDMRFELARERRSHLVQKTQLGRLALGRVQQFEVKLIPFLQRFGGDMVLRDVGNHPLPEERFAIGIAHEQRVVA
jgi:hypothetical protein